MTHTLPIFWSRSIDHHSSTRFKSSNSFSPKFRKISWRSTLCIRIINILNRQTCRLRNNKPRNCKHNNRQAGVNETRFGSKITRINVIHVRSHKGKEPTSNSAGEEADRLRVLAETMRADFGADCPCNADCGVDSVGDEEVPVGKYD